jgi:type I restriction enzyme, S subunit
LRAVGKTQKDDQWKAKYKEPLPPDVSSLAALPEGRVWGTWDQISTWVTYGFTRPMPHVDRGIPIVTAKQRNQGKDRFR